MMRPPNFASSSDAPMIATDRGLMMRSIGNRADRAFMTSRCAGKPECGSRSAAAEAGRTLFAERERTFLGVLALQHAIDRALRQIHLFDRAARHGLEHHVLQHPEDQRGIGGERL